MNLTADPNDTSAASVLLAKFLCFQALAIPFSILGILGNIISIHVWTRKRMNWGMSSTSCYLVALACSDMIYLLVINILVLLPKWMKFDNNGDLVPVFTNLDQMSSIGQPLINVFSNISIYLVVAFTMERFIAVTFPMKGMVLCTPKRAKYIISGIVVTVTLLHIPDFLAMMPNMDKFHESSFYQIGYNWGVVVLLFAVVPILLLSIFNTMLIRSVIISNRSRKRMMQNQRCANSDQVVMTMTVILLVVLFFLFHTPAAIALCIWTYRKHANLIKTTSENNRWSLVFYSINFLTIFNYSLNFLAYSVTSYRFRRTTAELFGFSKPVRHSCNTTIRRDADVTVNLSTEVVSEEMKSLYKNSERV